MPITTVAERLTLFMATPVSDRTGWPGLFTFDVIADTLDMPGLGALRRPTSVGAPLPADGPQLLDVFRSELGLKLVKDRATVNFIVARVEPLIEN